MLRHMFTSPLNMYLRARTRPKGAMRPMPNLTETELETFGATVVEDFTWKQLLDTEELVYKIRPGIVYRLGLFLAEEVRDAISRHPKQPGPDVLDRFHQPVRLHQFVEDLLQNVLDVALVSHPLANEVAQTTLLTPDRCGNSLLLLGRHPADTQRLLHVHV